MIIEVDKTISISKVNQNFSAAARMTDDKEIITIMKNNKPKYVLMTFDKFEEYELRKGKNR